VQGLGTVVGWSAHDDQVAVAGFLGDGEGDGADQRGGGEQGDREPDVEADADEYGAEQERDPPAPGQERVLRATG
jgi:hypothetical protein